MMKDTQTRPVNKLTLVALIFGSLIFLVLLPVFQNGVPLVQLDSPSYLDMHSTRSIGYPLFLRAFTTLGVSLDHIAYIQAVIFATSLLYLGLALYKYSNLPLWLIMSVSLVLALNPETNKYHFTILTESLFMSVLLVYVAMWIILIHSYRRWALVTLGLLTVILFAIKPTAITFLVNLLLLPLFVSFSQFKNNDTHSKHISWKSYLLLLLGVACLYTANSALKNYSHGGSGEKLAFRMAFGKAALVSSSGENPYPEGEDSHRVWEVLESEMAPVRNVIATAPSYPISAHLSMNYEVFAEFPLLAKTYAQLQADAADRHQIIFDVSMARLAADPTDYFWLSVKHFYSLWTMFLISHPDEAATYKAFLSDNPNLPLGDEIAAISTIPSSQAKALVVQPVFYLVFVVSLICIVMFAVKLIGGKHRSTALTTAAKMAIMANGFLLFNALFGVGIPRYILGIFPILTLCCVFFFFMILTKFKKKI